MAFDSAERASGEGLPVGDQAKIDRLIESGGRLHQAGRFTEAEADYRRALSLDPDHPLALQLLGLARLHSGRPKEAIEPLRRAVNLDGGSSRFRFSYGLALNAVERFEEAADQFSRALELEPELIEAEAELGLALFQLGRLEEALDHYRRVIELKPEQVQVRRQYARVLHRLGRLAEAAEEYREVVRLEPDAALDHFTLGVIWTHLGHRNRAIESYREAIRLQPELAEAHNNLGNVLDSAGHYEEAVFHHRRAVELRPDWYGALANLGKTLARQGEMPAALKCLKKAMAVNPSDGLKIQMATLLPPIYGSVEEVKSWRRRLIVNLERLSRQKLHLDDPLQEVGLTNFRLVYQGFNDRDIQRQLAAIFTSACRFPATPRPPARNKGRIKVGFVSSYFRNHTIGRVLAGVIAELDRERFSVSVFSIGRHHDHLAQFIQDKADRYLALPYSLEAAHRAVAEAGLDVLVFTDIGMEPLTYFLAFHRLAPVQAATWGHPVTTGIETVDYFVSCRDFEPEDGQEHYTEELIRLDDPPTYYYRPRLPAGFKDRAQLGLPQDRPVYLCAQTLFKVHPIFDTAVAGILRRDPKGVVVFVHGVYRLWAERLAKRFRRTIPDAADRIVFQPRQPYGDYFSLLNAADVLLDTFPFGGGNTTYEALAVGTPIVSLKTAQMRGRMTYAIMNQAGVLDGVAETIDEYVESAVALGTDRARREEVRARILEGGERVYENTKVVRQLEDFFESAVARAGRAG